MSPNHLAPKPRKSSGTVVETFHEPRSAAVPAASGGGVSPPARTPGGTPGELAGEDACATSAGQFMAPSSGGKTRASALLLAVALLVPLAAFGSDPRSATNNSPEMLKVLPQLPMPKFEYWPVPPPRPTPTNVVSPLGA